MWLVLRAVLFALALGCVSSRALACSCLQPDEAAQRVASVGAKDADDAWLSVSGCDGFLWEQIDKSGRLRIFLGRETPQSAAPR
jgi:hypothetical protein